MKKEEIIQMLQECLEEGNQNGFVFHKQFLQELGALLKNASGSEKEIFNLLVRQLGYVRDFNRRVNEVDSNEIIKHTKRCYYSLHLQGGRFNIRLIISFMMDNTPVFLVAFYERSGKKKTNYSNYIEILDNRFKEIEGELWKIK